MVGLPMVNKFNELVLMDFVEINGKKLLVMVDMATNYCQETLLKRKKKKEEISEICGK